MNILKKIRSSSLFKSASIYTMTSIINSAIPFFLLPVLTRYLSPRDYGIVSMFGVLLTFVAPFTGLSIHGAIARVYYEKTEIDMAEYVTSCMYILITSTIIISIIFYIFAESIANLSSVPVQLVGIVVVISFAQFITQIVLTLWQVEVKPIAYGIYQISNTILNMLLSISFVVLFGLKWKGRIYAQLISLIIIAIIGIFILYKNKKIKIYYNFKYVKHALNFGVPLIPHSIGGVIMTMTDRIFITNMVGIQETGVYAVGYQIGMIINLITTSFNQAYVPWLYLKLKENIIKTKLKIVKFTYIYFITILIIALVLSLLAPKLLVFFVGKEFIKSSIYIVWIALGYAFNGMYFMIGNYILYTQNTSYLSMVTFITAIINIGLNYFFIKIFGAIGAAMATTMAYFIRFILTWKLSSKVYKMPWFFRLN